MHFGRRSLAAACAVPLVIGLAVGPAAADAPPENLATSSLRSPIAADSFYFVMTDRYRDGDPANNAGGVVGGPSKTGYEPTSDAFYHGGDLAGLTGRCDPDDPADDGLARIKRLGFTALWITPPFVQRTVQGTRRLTTGTGSSTSPSPTRTWGRRPSSPPSCRARRSSV